jgi:hypothetical protein
MVLGEDQGGGLRGCTSESEKHEMSTTSNDAVYCCVAKPVYAIISVIRSSGHRG